jgi:hypothetical protein
MTVNVIQEKQRITYSFLYSESMQRLQKQDARDAAVGVKEVSRANQFQINQSIYLNSLMFLSCISSLLLLATLVDWQQHEE